MRQVSIRAFRANMAKELGNLPFELMKNGQRVAVVAECVYTAEKPEGYTIKPKCDDPKPNRVHTSNKRVHKSDGVHSAFFNPMPKAK